MVAVRRGNRVNETRTVVAAVMVAVVAVVGGKDGILGTPTPSRAGTLRRGSRQRETRFPVPRRSKRWTR